MSSRKLNIIVAGAGIGGLTAAIALRRSGHKVTIYEKASLSHEIGQGITISPNGGRILRSLGFDFEKARMVEFLVARYQSAQTLEDMAPAREMPKEEQKFGLCLQTAYRVDLHRMLVQLATQENGDGEPIKIVTKTGVQEFDGDNGTMVLDSGESISADLIVAADGVKSTAAAHINGANCPPLESSDTLVYRFTISEDEILSDPVTKPVLDSGRNIGSFYLGPNKDRWLVRYCCRSDGLQNFALYVLQDSSEAQGSASELRYEADRTRLLEEMEGFNPALLRVAEKTTDVLPLWRVTTREPLSSFHRGNVVILGDAAHPVKPHLGQGAISAIEDGGVLDAVLQNVPVRGDLAKHISERLELYDRLRIPRTAVCKYYSDTVPFGNPVVEQKDKCEKFVKPSDLPPTLADLRYWINGVDVVADAKKHVQSMIMAS